MIKPIPVFLLILLITPGFLFSASKKPPSWITGLDKKVRALEKRFDGEFGVFVQDLTNLEAFSYNAEQMWYLSSTVKVPVAIALLQLVDEEKLKLTEKVRVEKEDYRDGAGPVNWLKPGSKVSYKYLLKQMLIYSDNAATDLIIKKVGLEKVNKVTADFAIKGQFGPITTLLDVRKKAYGEIHPDAEKLSNQSFFNIKKQRGKTKRMKQLAKELKVTEDKFKVQDLSVGFNRYYAKGWNSATLVSYAQLLRNLLNKKTLSAKSTQMLLDIMSGIHTGKRRVTRGLAENVLFAHKTGTQHRQACDIGIASTKESRKPSVLILVCTRNWKKLSHAEKLMAKIGQLVSRTSLFSTLPE